MSNNRNVRAITAILTALLILPSSAVAGVHHKFVSSVSALSDADSTYLRPPPNEPPPPPPPGEALLSDRSSSKSVGDAEGARNLHQFNAEGARAEQVLSLPQVIHVRTGLVQTAKREDRANRFDNCDELQPGDYFEYDDSTIEAPESRDPEIQAPSTSGAYSGNAAPGGFIPLNPRGVIVRPGAGGPIPPTSPLLTPPPGSAAMPGVWPR
jgi:hypothetical protein